MSTISSARESVGRQTFTSVDTGPAIWLFLAWQHGHCALDLVIDFENHAPGWNAAEIQILAQPRSDVGLSDGDAIVIFRQEVALRNGPAHRKIGHLRLPSTILPEVARSCYYRVDECSK